MAIQNQFIVPFTHQDTFIPEAENCIYYFNLNNRLCLWTIKNLPTTYTGGGILQSVFQGAVGATNSGGGNRNGGFGYGGGFGGATFPTSVKSDSDGRYIDFANNSSWNGTSIGVDDGSPGYMGPGGGGKGAQSAYPGGASLSLALVFKYVPSSVSGTYAPIFGVSGNAAPASNLDISFAINSSNNKMVALGLNSSFSTSVRNTFSFTFSQNVLYDVVFTLTQGGVISMYVNGSFSSSYTESSTINGVGTDVAGPPNAFYDATGTSNGYTSFIKGTFCGKIYKQVAWTTVLSAADVSIFHANRTD